MKKLVLTTAMLGILASPAFAAEPNARNSFAQMPSVSKQTARAVKTAPVVVDGKLIGMAPDPAIRGAMIADYYSALGGGGDAGDAGGAAE